MQHIFKIFITTVICHHVYIHLVWSVCSPVLWHLQPHQLAPQQASGWGTWSSCPHCSARTWSAPPSGRRPFLQDLQLTMYASPPAQTWKEYSAPKRNKLNLRLDFHSNQCCPPHFSRVSCQAIKHFQISQLPLDLSLVGVLQIIEYLFTLYR